MGKSKKDATLEACAGALQNLTASKGLVRGPPSLPQLPRPRFSDSRPRRGPCFPLSLSRSESIKHGGLQSLVLRTRVEGLTQAGLPAGRWRNDDGAEMALPAGVSRVLGGS